MGEIRGRARGLTPTTHEQVAQCRRGVYVLSKYSVYSRRNNDRILCTALNSCSSYTFQQTSRVFNVKLCGLHCEEALIHVKRSQDESVRYDRQTNRQVGSFPDSPIKYLKLNYYSSLEQIWASVPAVEPPTAKWVIVQTADPLWVTYTPASRWLMSHVANQISVPVVYSLNQFLKPWIFTYTLFLFFIYGYRSMNRLCFQLSTCLTIL